MPTDPSEPVPTLRLADHLRACIAGEQLVLLDLDRNRYFSLSGRHAELVIKATRPANTAEQSRPAPGDQALIEPLLRHRILSSEPATPPVRRAPYVAALSTVDSQRTTQARIRTVDVIRFLFALALASLWLRFRSLQGIAHSVQVLQRRSLDSAASDHARRLARAVAVFDQLRPLAFTAREKCLYDSLALVTFLALKGLDARWVIGVSTRPFRAHSWVQDRGEVLNDLHENVRRFTPILVV